MGLSFTLGRVFATVATLTIEPGGTVSSGAVLITLE